MKSKIGLQLVSKPSFGSRHPTSAFNAQFMLDFRQTIWISMANRPAKYTVQSISDTRSEPGLVNGHQPSHHQLCQLSTLCISFVIQLVPIFSSFPKDTLLKRSFDIFRWWDGAAHFLSIRKLGEQFDNEILPPFIFLSTVDEHLVLKEASITN